MAPLFSQMYSNELWRDVQNVVTLICDKFGKDMINISKVIGHLPCTSLNVMNMNTEH